MLPYTLSIYFYRTTASHL